MKYYFSKVLNASFDEAIEQTKSALSEEGFGIITEIDIKETFKKKLDKDFRNYTILGACNPNFAFEALHQEDKVGTMLPCNVIIQELEDGKTEVAAINPVASMTAVENKDLKKIAGQVESRLKEAVDSL